MQREVDFIKYKAAAYVKQRLLVFISALKKIRALLLSNFYIMFQDVRGIELIRPFDSQNNRSAF